jgi:hypothetical protein
MSQDTYEADGVIVNGELKPVALAAFRQAMKRFPNEARVVIGVKVCRPRRSDAQNRFWHGVVIPLFMDYFNQSRRDEEKWTFDDVKDVLARKLLPVKEVIDPVTGEVFYSLGKTSDLNTKQFNELIERAQVWGAELTPSLYVPDPNEMGYAA